MTVTFTVPGAPQGKGRARSTITGRHYTPAKTVAYESLVAIAAHQAMAGALPITGACLVEMEAIYAVPASASKKVRAASLSGLLRPTKKPDGDNVIKAICDGMNGVVWKDDVQAVDIRLVKRYGEAPGVRVRVSVL